MSSRRRERVGGGSTSRGSSASGQGGAAAQRSARATELRSGLRAAHERQASDESVQVAPLSEREYVATEEVQRAIAHAAMYPVLVQNVKCTHVSPGRWRKGRKEVCLGPVGEMLFWKQHLRRSSKHLVSGIF